MDESIQAVKQKYSDELMAMDGVVAVGIGLDDDGQPAIIATLAAGKTETAAGIPETLEGYTVIIQYSNTIKAQ